MTGTTSPTSLTSPPMRPTRTDEQLRADLKTAAGELRLEDLEPTEAETELVLRRARGEITEEEFLRLARAHARAHRSA